jgi:hypothetical protein
MVQMVLLVPQQLQQALQVYHKLQEYLVQMVQQVHPLLLLVLQVYLGLQVKVVQTALRAQMEMLELQV